MSADSRRRTLAVAGWLRSASLLVPEDARDAWRRRYTAILDSVGVLYSRGELPGEGSACYLWLCRDAAVKAVTSRFGRLEPQRWIRSPLFFMSAISAALLFLAFATRGFAVSRSLLDTLRNSVGGAYPDRLIATAAPIALAVLTAVLTAVSRASLSGHRWGYILFFLVKTLSLEAITLALWVEGGTAIRSCLHFETLRVLAGGVMLAIVFIAAFVWVMIWSVEDQQHRCPICVRRLVLPVRVGSWGSVLEPVATEWLCEVGHGWVCVSEIEHGKLEHWAKLEA